VRYLIVDGYNLLFAEQRYSSLAASDLEVARARLVEDVAAYAGSDTRAIVVFDGADNPHSDGKPHHVAGVAVVFSRAGQDADSVIEALAHRYRPEGGVVVATSDGETQAVIMGEGAIRMSAAELVRDMAAAREAADDPPTGRRGPAEERIDPRVRERLSRWARGG
jgi:predicted RNA-binding protein with PIN domain